MLLSIGIPLITFTQYIEVERSVSFLSTQNFILTDTITNEPINIDYTSTILWSIYLLGVVLFLFRFLKNLFQLNQKIRKNVKFKNKEFTNVLLNDLVHPHTFLNYIFLNKTNYENNQLPDEVLLHEETHAKQKHTIDILFIEFLQITFWFNPLLYVIKKDIKLNHEFLADHAVLKRGVNKSTYQKILLAFATPNNYIKNHSSLANSINYLLIKKRFTVMKIQTSKTVFWFRSLLLLPILCVLIYGFSQHKVVEKPVEIHETEVTEAMIQEYIEFIDKYEKTKIIDFLVYERIVAIYELMSDKQRNTVKKYPDNMIPSLAKVKYKIPIENEFNQWKNSEKFAIWINGRSVKNTELDNYKATDFKYYTSSFVHNNARSKKYPQPYQNHLYTEKGFEETYLKYGINKFRRLFDEYKKLDDINDFEKQLIKVQLEKLYKSLSNQDIKKYNIKNPATLNVFKKNINKDTIPKNIESYVQARTYVLNFIKKQDIDYPLGYLTLSETEQKYFNKLYRLMSDEYMKLSESERKSAPLQIAPPPSPKEYELIDGKFHKKKVVGTFPPPPPPLSPLPKNPSKALIELKKKYDEQQEIYGKLISSLINEKKGTTEELRKASVHVTNLYKEYSAMAEKEKDKRNKSKVEGFPPPPPPLSPLPKNPSKALLELKKKYDQEIAIYGKLIGSFISEKKGTTEELRKASVHVTNLYKEYSAMAKKEKEN
ncbi:M56 family metallopeptidase [Wenyingzhuangia sp. chi5]|uniref:M56 family metallopeptidase n=1 Tax=Wenyingzhuangia gilva TaxID=3057677 RepID=A0ABT8VTC6_9FLAO|nr:M56 family metallopeptidase [Wenyingzhuangia sp. chi5]